MCLSGNSSPHQYISGALSACWLYFPWVKDTYEFSFQRSICSLTLVIIWPYCFCRVDLGVLARRGWGDKHQPRERNPWSTSHYFLIVAKGTPRKCPETNNMAVGRSGSCCQLPSQLVVLPRSPQTLILKIPLSLSRTKGLAQPGNSKCQKQGTFAEWITPNYDII